MKTNILVACALSSAVLLFAADQPKKETSEVEELRSRVATLEKRLNELEAKLEKQASGSTFLLPEPPRNAPESMIPPNVGELEVNGLKAFLVPLGAKGQ